MHKLVQRIVKRIDHLNKTIGEAFIWLIPVLIVLQFIFFLAEKIYQFPFIEMHQTMIFLNGGMLMMAVGYAALTNHHLRFSRAEKFFNKKTKAIINLLISFTIMLPLAFAVFGYSSTYLINGWQQQNSYFLEPVYKAIILVYAYLIALTALSVAGSAILSLTKLEESEPDDMSDQNGDQTKDIVSQGNSTE